MAVKLQCPHCEEKFRWEFSTKNKWPKHCPCCGDYVGIDRPDDDIVMPFIRRASTTATDKVYRDMEAGSETRMHAAAELLGVPASDMSGLKITDLNDRRDAETAAPPIRNEVTKFIEQTGFNGWNSNGAAHSTAVQTGPFPNAGAQMHQVVRGMHQDMVAQHCVGEDATTGKAVRPSIDVLSERPANEVNQPGYRRRA